MIMETLNYHVDRRRRHPQSLDIGSAIAEWEERLGCILPSEARDTLLEYYATTLKNVLLFAKPECQLEGRIVYAFYFVEFPINECAQFGMHDYVSKIIPDLLPGYLPFCEIGDTKCFFCVCCRPAHYGAIFLKIPRSGSWDTLDSASSSLYIPYARSIVDLLISTRTFPEASELEDLDKAVCGAQSLADVPERFRQLPWK